MRYLVYLARRLGIRIGDLIVIYEHKIGSQFEHSRMWDAKGMADAQRPSNPWGKRSRTTFNSPGALVGLLEPSKSGASLALRRVRHKPVCMDHAEGDPAPASLAEKVIAGSILMMSPLIDNLNHRGKITETNDVCTAGGICAWSALLPPQTRDDHKQT